MPEWFEHAKQWFEQMVHWFEHHEWVIWTATGATALVFVASLVLVPLVVAKLPADYFAHETRPPGLWSEKQGPLRWAIRIGKNVVGAFLIVAGVAMLILPGQGVLAILVGLVLLDVPGKYRVEKRIVRAKKVRQVLNWLRRKFGAEELEMEGASSSRGNDAE